jgi:ATP-binding cassette, subfamily F, member 3
MRIKLIVYPSVVLQGGLVLVSHDERLIRLVCSEIWVCADHRVTRIEGGIEEYKKLVEQELAASAN